MTLPPDYFDRMYDGSEDPWGFTTRWYERRKHAMTLAVLPEPRFGTALEVGCSIGLLTAPLPSAATGSSRSTRAPRRWPRPGSGPRRPTFGRGSVPDDWPAGTYDLVVLSEVGYYLDLGDLSALLDYTAADLAPDGFVVACHWRHPVEDYPQTGDAVHEADVRTAGRGCRGSRRPTSCSTSSTRPARTRSRPEPAWSTPRTTETAGVALACPGIPASVPRGRRRTPYRMPVPYDEGVDTAEIAPTRTTRTRWAGSPAPRTPPRWCSGWRSARRRTCSWTTWSSPPARCRAPVR